MDISTINKMTRQEKLQTLEVLWNALADDERDLASADWHREVLEARRAQIEAGTARFVSLDELKARRGK